MSRQTGPLRHRLKIYNISRVDDGYGGKTRADPSPETLIDTVWGKVEPASASETFRASRVEQVITHTGRIRYKPSLADIEGHIIDFRGRHMRIQTCINTDERNRWLDLTLREGGAL